ncbi:hypothetical protein LPW26_02120 [Rhodopseudomonas sp. HC1]|nr:hypothetical protein [Rhodopseudomonas infernalis]
MLGLKVLRHHCTGIVIGDAVNAGDYRLREMDDSLHHLGALGEQPVDISTFWKSSTAGEDRRAFRQERGDAFATSNRDW